jgi:hypothetical protein
VTLHSFARRYQMPLYYITEPVSHLTYLNPEGGGIMLLWSIGIHLQVYTPSQPRTDHSE